MYVWSLVYRARKVGGILALLLYLLHHLEQWLVEETHQKWRGCSAASCAAGRRAPGVPFFSWSPGDANALGSEAQSWRDSNRGGKALEG